MCMQFLMDKNLMPVRTEDLSRDEILNILQKRHLHIDHMNALSHSELVRVYKTFVLPMSRRPQRDKHLEHHNELYRMSPNNGEDDQMIISKDSSIGRISMDIDHPSEISDTSDNDQETSSVIFNPIGEKRRLTDDAWTEDYQYQLSKATKRIRIDAFF